MLDLSRYFSPKNPYNWKNVRESREEQQEQKGQEKKESKGKPKSRRVAFVLAVIFGGYGIHNFYLGFRTRGFCQLSLTLTGMLLRDRLWCGWLYLAAAAGWGIVDGIFLITRRKNVDGKGRDLKDAKGSEAGSEEESKKEEE